MLSRTGALAVLGCAALLGRGLPASGAPITTPVQTATVPLTPTDWAPGNFSADVNPLNFATFNPALGTLESVNLTLGYSFAQDISMTFKNPATIAVGVDQNSVALIRPDGSAITWAKPADYSVTQTYGGPTFPYTVTLPTHMTSGSATPVSLTSKADLALFTQSSPSDTLIKLPATATSHSSFVTSSGNGLGGASVAAGVVATLSYTYEPKPVPEPSTFAALGLGLGGYLLARRHRRVNASA